jgi:hypothetical protein
MTFEEALKLMRQGKKVKLPEQDYHLSLGYKIYYDSNLDRPVEILSTEGHVLREDWQVYEADGDC